MTFSLNFLLGKLPVCLQGTARHVLSEAIVIWGSKLSLIIQLNWMEHQLLDAWDRYRTLLQFFRFVGFMYYKSNFVSITTCLPLTKRVHNRAQYSEVLKVSDSTLLAIFCPTDKTLSLNEFPLTVYTLISNLSFNYLASDIKSFFSLKRSVYFSSFVSFLPVVPVLHSGLMQPRNSENS